MVHRVRSILALACTMALLPAWLAAQEPATVSGRVTSEGGLPLANASVFLQGLNIGTLTKEGGTYSFTVPAANVNGQPVTLTPS